MGRVLRLFRYPVKGLGGEELGSIYIARKGLVGDREYWISDAAKEKAGQSSRVTVRDPKTEALLGYRARLRGTLLDVFDEHGRPVDDVAGELSERLGRTVRIREEPGGKYDEQPVSILSEQTMDLLGDEHGSALDVRRFRPNVYVRWDGGISAYHENTLFGRPIQIGEARFELVQGTNKGNPVDGIGRCKVPTYDPTTRQQDISVLALVARKHGNIVGVYAKVVREGAVRAGDEVVPL